MHKGMLAFTIGSLFVSFGLLKLFGFSNNISITLALAINLFSLSFMSAFFAWQNRKIATKKEKYISYQSILSSALVGFMTLNGIFSNSSYYSMHKDIFLTLSGVMVVIGWSWYIQHNPELSNQKLELVTMLAILNIMLGCLNLFSSFGVHIAFLPILLIMIGLTAFFMYQDKIYRN